MRLDGETLARIVSAVNTCSQFVQGSDSSVVRRVTVTWFDAHVRAARVATHLARRARVQQRCALVNV